MLVSRIAKPSSVRFVSSKCKPLILGIRGIDFARALTCSMDKATWVTLSSCKVFASRSSMGRASFVYLEISLQNWNFASLASDELLTGETCFFIIAPNSIFLSNRFDTFALTSTPKSWELFSFWALKKVARVVYFSISNSSSLYSLLCSPKLIALSRSSKNFCSSNFYLCLDLFFSFFSSLAVFFFSSLSECLLEISRRERIFRSLIR